MKDDSVYLRQIMDAVNRVQEYTGGLDFEAFTRNHAVRDAVILQVALISAARRAMRLRDVHACDESGGEDGDTTRGRMAYTVDYRPRALERLKTYRAYERAKITDNIAQFLTTQPTAVGPVRIKQYQGIIPPLYRLRVDNVRVMFEVDETENTVTILDVLPKPEVEPWLAERQKEVRKREINDTE